jgi:hypothetical protein
MFRLTQFNTSNRNHRILNQSTKISGNESPYFLKYFQPEMIPEVSLETKSLKTSETSENVEDLKMESMCSKMNRMKDYVEYMKMLEIQNSILEYENVKFKEENSILKNEIKLVQNDFLSQPVKAKKAVTLITNSLNNNSLVQNILPTAAIYSAERPQ